MGLPSIYFLVHYVCVASQVTKDEPWFWFCIHYGSD